MNSKVLTFVILSVSIFQVQSQLAPCYDDELQCLIDAVSSDCPMAKLEYGCKMFTAQSQDCCYEGCSSCLACLDTFGCCEAGDTNLEFEVCLDYCQNHSPQTGSGHSKC